MKLTKPELRRIIQEEHRRMLSEQNVPQQLIEDLSKAMYAILGNLETYGDMDPLDVAPHAAQIIQDELNGFIEATHTERQRTF